MYIKREETEPRDGESVCVFLTLVFKLSKGWVRAIKWQFLELHADCLRGKNQFGRDQI